MEIYSTPIATNKGGQPRGRRSSSNIDGDYLNEHEDNYDDDDGGDKGFEPSASKRKTKRLNSSKITKVKAKVAKAKINNNNKKEDKKSKNKNW